jgi:1-phosphatidylinositol phosphodiesterase
MLSVAVALLAACSSSSHAPSTGLGSTAPGSDWMAKINDNAGIAQLGIPGTHDTCTYTQYATMAMGYVKTQDLSLVDQLNKGIRFLDIRGRLFQNSLTIHHGPYFLGMGFQDVIDDCKKFLKEHRTETILMNLGPEYDSDSQMTYQQVFNNYVNTNKYLDGTTELWYLGTFLPKLGQARGKIILLRTFPLDPPSTALGIDFSGGGNIPYYAHQFSTNPDQTLHIENLWSPSYCGSAYDDKETAIGANINRKQGNDSPNHLYVTLTSATIADGWQFCFLTPRTFADHINPWFMTSVNPSKGPVGVVVMDFPGDDQIKLILDSNEKLRATGP